MVAIKDLMKGSLKWLFTVQAALRQDKTNGYATSLFIE